MKQRVVLGLCAVVFVAFPAAVMADDIKSVDVLIAKYIEAVGGRKAIDSVKTMRMTGKNIMAGGMEMPLVMEFKAPNKLRVNITFQGMSIVQAFDGTTGWMIMPFSGNMDPQKMSKEDVATFEKQADIQSPFVDYAKKGNKVELVGKKEVDGSEVYDIKVTYKDGMVAHYFLDSEYFLPVKVTGKRKTQGMEMEIETTLGDYKEVGGLMIPHSMSTHAESSPMPDSTVTFDKTELNVDVADSRFAMPKVKAPEVAPKPTAVNTSKKAPAVDKP